MNINNKILLIALFNTPFVFSAAQSNEDIDRKKRCIKSTSNAIMVGGMAGGLFAAMALKESSPEAATAIAGVGMFVAVASHVAETIIDSQLEKQRRNS